MQSIRALAITLTMGFTWLSPSKGLAASPDPYPECNRVPSESEVSAAKGAFEAGQVSFHEADYARAILFWEDAFRRDCTALALLLNLARAYELAEQYDKGRVALETYLIRKPDDPDRPAIERRIDHLVSKEQEAAAKAPPEKPIEPVSKPDPEDDDVHEEEGSKTKLRPNRPIWPVIVTGAGLVTTGVGLGLLIPGQTALSGYTTGGGLCATQNDDGAYACRADPATGRSELQVQADAENARLGRNIGIAVTAVGAAAVATGAVFWILEWKKERPEPAAWLPWFGPGALGVTYSGRF
jgi:tetratricopeptide (TPR) repeat protein